MSTGGYRRAFADHEKRIKNVQCDKRSREEAQLEQIIGLDEIHTCVGIRENVTHGIGTDSNRCTHFITVQLIFH